MPARTGSEEDPTREAPAAVLFDMDGVLVDTEGLKAEAHALTVARLGGKVPASLYEAVMGEPHAVVARAFADAGGVPLDLVAYGRAFAEAYESLVEDRLEITPGAIEVLRALAGGECRLAVVSSSQRRMMERILRLTRLAGYFAASISAEDVRDEKPSPEPYLRALRALGVPSGRAVAVEDTETGIEAARRAGLRVIAVRHRYNSQHDLSRAAVVLPSLADTEAAVRAIVTRLRRSVSS
ncbi:MAG: HAD family hydrolase [Gemmatimonadota bacterium]